MDHPTLVREPRRLEDLDRDVDRADRVERRLFADQLLQRPAGEVLHRDVVRVVVRTPVVHADHIRVLETGGRLSLAAEPFDKAGVLGEAAVEQLQRDLAAELLILGKEHVGHSARPEPGKDLVSVIDERPGIDHWCSANRSLMICAAIGAA